MGGPTYVDIFEGVMRMEIMEGSVSGLRGVVVSGFSEVVRKKTRR